MKNAPQKSKGKNLWAKVRQHFLEQKQGVLKFDKNTKYNLIPKHIQELKSQKISIEYDFVDFKIRTQSSLPQKNKALNPTNKQIDSTGLWIWEAEEIMAYFLNSNLKKFGEVKSVLELGAGTSGLASLLLAKQLKPNIHKIIITDGNQDNIRFLEQNAAINAVEQQVNVKHLLWGEKTNETYDLILAADCLYFEKYHKELINSLIYSLSQNGQAIFVNPKRGQSTENFLKLVQKSQFLSNFLTFKDSKYEKQQKRVSQQKNYQQDKDKYYFISVRKIRS